jgi:hypothetical protein
VIYPIDAADVDPRSFGCRRTPHRLLVVSHAPKRRLDDDVVVCGFCRVPWATLQHRIAALLLAERARALLDP